MSAGDYEIIVIGGGASGLMAAIWSARRGRRVLILDHHPVSAKKLLATGNGRCNFTNKVQGRGCYRCDDPDFVSAILKQFTADDAISFFEELGIRKKERMGYCYPRSLQAAAIRDALLAEAARLDIVILNEIGIRSVKRLNNRFCIHTKSGDFYADKCILAAGGKASPGTGSDGSGYIYAGQLGHRIIPPLPALVPLTGTANWLSITAGVRCEASVTLYVDGKEAARDCGELQMTDYGISGIPVFQVSRYASTALAREASVCAEIDFLPEMDEKAVRAQLVRQAEVYGGVKGWTEILSGFVNRKIAVMICRELRLADATGKKQQDKTALRKQADQIVRLLKKTKLPVTGTRGFGQAQATCGGITVSQICCGTMESKIVPGLFFAGEIVDVDGICGGYNLQWAWSSGYAAGCAAAADR